MLVFSLVFGKLLPNQGVRSYQIFILVGLLPWQFFTGTMIGGTTSVTSGAHMIGKIYFPRELLPTSSMLSNLVNFLLAFIVLIIFLYIGGIGLTVNALWVPVLLLTQMLFMLGLVLALSTINVLLPGCYDDLGCIVTGLVFPDSRHLSARVVWN